MTAGEPAKTGRPSTYTPELVAAICERIARGASVMRAATGEGIPETTFLGWVFDETPHRAAVSEQYERARAMKAERFLDDMIEIADDADAESVQVARLRCDVRDKALARIAPKRYADMKRVQLSGGIERRKRIILDDGTGGGD